MCPNQGARMIKRTSLVMVSLMLIAAAPAPATKPTDLDALQGKWKTGLIKSNGRDVTAQNSYEFKVVNDTTVIAVNGDERVSHFKLNPDKKPREIDWTTPKGQTLLGVYEISGDTWMAHLARAGQERPKDLSQDTGAFYRYDRVE